jgi:hypothetical protein
MKRKRNFLFSNFIVKIAVVFSLLASSILILVFLQMQIECQNIYSHAQVTDTLSGEAMSMSVGGLAGWKQIFTDDFITNVPVGGFSGCDTSDGTCSGLPSDVKAKWWAYSDGWKDTSKNGTYTPSKVISVSNGVMTLFLHTENNVFMVAALVPKLPEAIGSGGGLK